MTSIVTPALVDWLTARFRLDIDGPHGLRHWQRVRRNAHWVARELRSDIDLEICDLFAFLHDCRREDENTDPEHGPRAAEVARDLHGRFYDIGHDRLELLVEAVGIHESQRFHQNPTVAVCLDADRLDLGRVGITPDRRYLNTSAARSMIWRCVPRLLHKTG